jgi:predicted nucleotidyltransferase
MAFFVPVFKQLNTANVRYVVVGGVATILHGYVRATTDIDLIVDLQVEEATRIIQVLVDAGYKPRIPVPAIDFADAAKREDWISTKGMTVFSMFHPEHFGLSIDLFAKSPINFDELWERSNVFDVAGTGIRACSLDDLLTLKKMAGRSKDKDDIEKLMKIKVHGREK